MPCIWPKKVDLTSSLTLHLGYKFRAFGVALRGVEQSKTPAYFGLECGVFTPIGSAIQSAIQNSGLFWIWSADCTPKVSECQMLCL